MEFSVQARENSTSYGVGVSVGTYDRGDIVTITCNPEEEWHLGPTKALTCNANGLNDGNKNPDLNIAYGTLVGSINEGRSLFTVGTKCQLTITSDQTILYLYCLDTNNADNSGNITAVVRKG